MHITCNKYATKILLLLSIRTRHAAQEGGGGTLIFSYTRRLRPFLGVQKFQFQYVLGFSEKLIFLGYEDFVDILASYHIIGLYLRVISMHFRVFSFSQGTLWGIFLGVAKI